jgi:hypothetical protein
LPTHAKDSFMPFPSMYSAKQAVKSGTFAVLKPAQP